MAGWQGITRPLIGGFIGWLALMFLLSTINGISSGLFGITVQGKVDELLGSVGDGEGLI